MLRPTSCRDWLISLLACSSGKLKLVAILVLVVRTPAAVDHCRSFLVFLTGSFSILALARIDSLAPELTRALTRRVLDCLPFLPARMTSLTKIIGLKCLCFSFFLDLVCLTILDGLRRVFYRWASFNSVSKLFELSLCSLMLYVIFVKWSMIIKSLQPFFQASSSVSVVLSLLLSLPPRLWVVGHGIFLLTRGILFLAAWGVTFRVLQNDWSLLLRGCLVEDIVLEVLCLFKGGFLLDDIEFPGLFLEVLLEQYQG